jgi:hypothetical protein
VRRSSQRGCWALTHKNDEGRIGHALVFCSPQGWFIEQKVDSLFTSVASLLASFKGLNFAAVDAAVYDAFFGKLAQTAASASPAVLSLAAASTLPRNDSFGTALLPSSTAPALGHAATTSSSVASTSPPSSSSGTPPLLAPSASTSTAAPAQLSPRVASPGAVPIAPPPSGVRSLSPGPAQRSLSPGPLRRAPPPGVRRDGSPPASPKLADYRAQSARHAPRPAPAGGAAASLQRVPSNPGSLARGEDRLKGAPLPSSPLSAAASLSASPAPASVASTAASVASAAAASVPAPSSPPPPAARLAVSTPTLTTVSTSQQPVSSGTPLATGVSVLLTRLQYMPGDLVSGSVQLMLKAPRGVKELLVVFQGTDTRTERGNSRTSNSLLFKVSKKLVASTTPSKTMTAGTFTYPFSFSTRIDLPATCFLANPDGSARRVLYELQAHLKLQRGKNRSVHQEIAITGRPAAPLVPLAKAPAPALAAGDAAITRRPSLQAAPSSDAVSRRPSGPHAISPRGSAGADAAGASGGSEAPTSPARIRPQLSRREHMRGNIRGAAVMGDLQSTDLQMQLDIEAVIVQYDEQIQELLDEIMRREIVAATARFDSQLAPLLAALNERLNT